MVAHGLLGSSGEATLFCSALEEGWIASVLSRKGCAALFYRLQQAGKAAIELQHPRGCDKELSGYGTGRWLMLSRSGMPRACRISVSF